MRRAQQIEQRPALGLRGREARIESVVMYDDWDFRRCQHGHILGDHHQRCDHLDVPIQRTGLRFARLETHIERRFRTERRVEIDAQAAHPAPVEIGKHVGRHRLIAARYAAATVAKTVQGFQQQGIVGAVKARLHDHEAADVTRCRQSFEIVKACDAGEIGPVDDLRISFDRADYMNVAVAADAHAPARRDANASPVSRVPSLPPMSAVVSLAATAASTLRSIAAAAVSNAFALRRRPCQVSSMAADKMSESGLATFLPAMSGAEPCAACAIACSAPALSEAARPRLPDSSAVRSERMSPNMLVVTITSKRCGLRTTCAIMASTIISSSVTSGNSRATLLHSSMKIPSVTLSTLALCTMVTCLRRPCASSNAARAMRSQQERVMRRNAIPTSLVSSTSPLP